MVFANDKKERNYCKHEWMVIDSIQKPSGDLDLYRECIHCKKKDVYTVDGRNY